MKKFTIFLQLVCVIVFFSCEKDEERAIINEEDAAPPTLISPTNFYEKVIEEQDLDELITFVWEPVRYGLNTPVTYTLAIDSASREFSGEKILGSSMTSTLTMTIGELNDILVDDLKITPNEAATIEVKVTSRLANSDRILESDVIALIITPLQTVAPPDPKLWVAGDFQGWDINAATPIASNREEGVYEGYINIPEGGTNEFKLYGVEDSWGAPSYGDGGAGTIIEHNEAGNNFVAPSPGYYHLAVDLDEMTFLLVEIETWGIIGDATPGGWDASTPMTFDSEAETWSITADLVPGQFKVRANDAWIIDLGVAEEGLLRYENHPLIPYVEGARIVISEAGNYTFTIDLSEAGNYTYKVEKN